MFAKIASLVSVVSVLSLLGFSSCGVVAEEQAGEVKQRIPSIQGRTRRPEKIEKAREKSERRARKQVEAAARREKKLKMEGSVDLKDFFWGVGIGISMGMLSTGLLSRRQRRKCPATGKSDHPLNQECATIPITLERRIPMTKRKRETFTPEFKAKVVLEALKGESSQAEVCRWHNLSEDQLSTWKQQLLENAASLFESRNKPSKETTKRIAELEQHLGRLILATDIQRKALALLSEKTDPDAQGGEDSSE